MTDTTLVILIKEDLKKSLSFAEVMDLNYGFGIIPGLSISVDKFGEFGFKFDGGGDFINRNDIIEITFVDSKILLVKSQYPHSSSRLLWKKEFALADPEFKKKIVSTIKRESRFDLFKKEK